MKYQLIIITLALLAALSSCKKDSESTIFYWNETGCAAPWKQDSDDTEEERKAEIKRYLENQNVKVEKIEFEFDQAKMQNCYACHCTTGRIIVVKVAWSDMHIMKQLNFYQ
ncbi:hypothetical protein [Pontibacter anaerobius]|uniref:Uncharacterized protein n=1 Tax=Pontibacter anaerobius TaxID=2993940 RepID=A0ABT3RG67_9BACT|nr:hypothetical protein [Pontibacter anaerobius]MCX2740409.1 hypothetical protein [Pontibacter anaerobius]